MANIKSAEKRGRQALQRRTYNRHYRSQMRSSIKKLRDAVAAGDQATAAALLTPTLQLVDRTAQKQVIHRNAAARTKSRLTRLVAGMQAQA